MRPLVLAAFAIPYLMCQPTSSNAVLSNLATAKWVHDQGDPPGSTNVLLREDAKTGAMELLVKYPAGHVFRPHWHTANERIILLEGRLSLKQPDGEKLLDPGGYAYLPAKEVQRLSCVSKTPCTWYIYWDGKLDFHPAQ